MGEADQVETDAVFLKNGIRFRGKDKEYLLCEAYDS